MRTAFAASRCHPALSLLCLFGRGETERLKHYITVTSECDQTARYPQELCPYVIYVIMFVSHLIYAQIQVFTGPLYIMAPTKGGTVNVALT